MTAGEFMIEALKMLVPLGLAYVGVLKTRTELDILYAKQRGGTGKMRRRWYTRMFYKQEISNVLKLSSAATVENDRQGLPGEVPVGPGGEGASPEGPPGERGKD